MSGATSNEPVSNRSVGVVGLSAGPTSVVAVVVVMWSPGGRRDSHCGRVGGRRAPGLTLDRRSRENPAWADLPACHDDAVTATDPRGLRGFLPLLVVSVVVVAVAFGLSRGVWLANLHNGLLALSLTMVGAYVLFQRPGHREGLLFLAAGVVEAVMFYGRQVGHAPTSDASRWWGWLGVWPLAIALALTTFAVICFPDGRLPSRRWRPVAVVVVVLALGCAAVSAIWPVEYASAGVVTPHPFHAGTPDLRRPGVGRGRPSGVRRLPGPLGGRAGATVALLRRQRTTPGGVAGRGRRLSRWAPWSSAW